ncbi:hypothetical protein [Chitinophaga filiformis]|uniref:Uncharacterized protein n=1 Tax=Chitinophaga filiformis TaxID=104663 RepID=A0ABY4I9P1_CHIFI|nr:hypothetical protein [Chitinophaga filiformis]UPK72815.1 hypothetical protein MYF79_16105 [Chitinophaga filiformis]
MFIAQGVTLGIRDSMFVAHGFNLGIRDSVFVAQGFDQVNGKRISQNGGCGTVFSIPVQGRP